MSADDPQALRFPREDGPEARAAARTARVLIAARSLGLDVDTVHQALLAFAHADRIAVRIDSRMTSMAVLTRVAPDREPWSNILPRLARNGGFDAAALMRAPAVLPEVLVQPRYTRFSLEAAHTQPIETALQAIGATKLLPAAKLLGPEAHGTSIGHDGARVAFRLPATHELRARVMDRVDRAMRALGVMDSHIKLAHGLHGALSATSLEVTCRLRAWEDRAIPELTLEYEQVQLDDMIRLFMNFAPSDSVGETLGVFVGALGVESAAGLEIAYSNEDPPGLRVRFDLDNVPCGLRGDA